NAEHRMSVVNGQVVDDLDRRQMEAEDLMLGMRMARGVSDERVASALEWIQNALDELESLEADGYVEHVDGRWRPTRLGWLCGNDLYSRLLDLAP
ncbi:MAG: coproporphyrinogen III oxidase family protein, partial [Eggerthellaceae bacterium]|nr:coproporphyrinogen III oxidase family protein [Eggerthellaceae bacterium]